MLNKPTKFPWRSLLGTAPFSPLAVRTFTDGSVPRRDLGSRLCSATEAPLTLTYYSRISNVNAPQAYRGTGRVRGGAVGEYHGWTHE